MLSTWSSFFPCGNRRSSIFNSGKYGACLGQDKPGLELRLLDGEASNLVPFDWNWTNRTMQFAAQLLSKRDAGRRIFDQDRPRIEPGRQGDRDVAKLRIFV